MFNPFKKKQYIFSINTGRAGSEYLSDILATAKSVWAAHEPNPQMIGKYLKLICENDYQSTYKDRRFKADEVKKIIKKSLKTNYIETNHMFIKTFFDVVVNELDNIKVVFLKRNIVDTLHSFYQLGYFSDRNEAWKDWMVSPYARTAAIPCFLEEDEKDDIGLSLAYLIDIYERGYRFMEQYPQIPVFQIELQDLNNVEKVKELFVNLNLTSTQTTFNVTGQRKNNRKERKKQIGSKEIAKEYIKERAVAYIDKLEAKGYEVRNKIVI